MRRELKLMDNKARFIDHVNREKGFLSGLPKAEIEAKLKELQFATDADVTANASKNDSFDYLLGMPIYSLTKEKVEELRAKIAAR